MSLIEYVKQMETLQKKGYIYNLETETFYKRMGQAEVIKEENKCLTNQIKNSQNQSE